MAAISADTNITAIQLKESSAPSAPASGFGKVYVSTTGVLRYINDASADEIVHTGTLAVASGGTGATTLTGLLLGNGTGAVTAITTSAGIRTAISDETGTGVLVFATTPTLVTPVLGAATGTSVNLGGSAASTPLAVKGSVALSLEGSASTNLWQVYTHTDASFRLNYNGVSNDELIVYNTGGMVFGSATGDDKGAGTINAKALYDDGTILSDWVFDLYYDGRTDQPVPDGSRLYQLTETLMVTRLERRLPWMPLRAEFEAQRSLGGMVTRLWFGQEQQQLYIQDLATRLAALERN